MINVRKIEITFHSLICGECDSHSEEAVGFADAQIVAREDGWTCWQEGHWEPEHFCPYCSQHQVPYTIEQQGYVQLWGKNMEPNIDV